MLGKIVLEVCERVVFELAEIALDFRQVREHKDAQACERCRR